MFLQMTPDVLEQTHLLFYDNFFFIFLKLLLIVYPGLALNL